MQLLLPNPTFTNRSDFRRYPKPTMPPSMKDQKEYKEKEIPYERVLFFSDAIVAIAITLLALDLRLELPEDHTFTFQDLLSPWKNYLAFALSFINIANFWKTHHNIFTYAHKMNDKMLALNVSWLFFIVTLPFSTSVLSSYFGTTPAVFLYSLNVFLLSLFQNFIWDYADTRDGYMDTEALSEDERKRLRTMFNLDMLNGLVAIVLSFTNPMLAFILLFFKIPTLVMLTFLIRGRRVKKIVRKGRETHMKK